MNNIKQIALKFIFSFLCLIFIASCDQIKSFSNFKNVLRKNVVDIAILLPLSGDESKLSEEYVKMIKMGLSDGIKTKIRVTTYDSQTQEKLNASLDKIFDLGTDIIIGPINSESTKLVSQKIRDKSTIVLSLSDNPVLTDKNLYIFGHSPMRQLDQIANYFLDNNYQNYIALLPEGRNSTIVGQILKDIVTNGKGSLDKIEFYKSDLKDIEQSIKTVSENVDILNESDLNLKQPIIFLSDDPEKIGILYHFIKKTNLDKRAIIAGDSRLDISHANPIDIVFTGSLNIQDTDILTRANKSGIQNITFMHFIAYDAGKMIGDYVGSSYNRTRFLDKMNSNKSFLGISGDIHFVDNIAQRKYDIVQKENNRYKAIISEIETSSKD